MVLRWLRRHDLYHGRCYDSVNTTCIRTEMSIEEAFTGKVTGVNGTLSSTFLWQVHRNMPVMHLCDEYEMMMKYT